jgi:hypothetical protein
MLGIRRDGTQRLAGSPEQNVVDDLLVLQGNGGDGLRYGEDNVKILGVEKLGLPSLFGDRATSTGRTIW